MIRKLMEEDKERVIEFLSEEAAINLFIIGDVENFGFETEFMETWGSFDDRNNITGILLRFYESYIPYYKKYHSDIDEFKSMIKKAEGKKMISGKRSIMKDFKDVFQDYKERETYFCELTNDKLLREFDSSVKLVKIDDVKRLSDFINSINEFSADKDSTEDKISKTIESNLGRIYYIEDGHGKIISSSQTTAENSKSAMVVGVATSKENRNKGLTSNCLSKLCYDLLSEGKTLCLFYDNPLAGRIYKKLGFEDIDKWTMISEI
ncbi:MAG: GNAT family N-acetyltransferase [Clostridium sp.]